MIQDRKSFDEHTNNTTTSYWQYLWLRFKAKLSPKSSCKDIGRNPNEIIRININGKSYVYMSYKAVVYMYGMTGLEDRIRLSFMEKIGIKLESFVNYFLNNKSGMDVPKQDVAKIKEKAEDLRDFIRSVKTGSMKDKAEVMNNFLGYSTQSSPIMRAYLQQMKDAEKKSFDGLQ